MSGTIWHLVTGGRSRAQLEAEIGCALIRDMVARIAARSPSARIGVALNQHVGPERTLADLRAKLDAGASFVQTQLVPDLDVLWPLAELSRLLEALATSALVDGVALMTEQADPPPEVAGELRGLLDLL